MSDNLILLSSDTISDGDFATFLTGKGGVVKPGGAKDGALSRGECGLWFFISPETLSEICGDEKDLVNDVTEKLGSMPRSCVVVEGTSDPETDGLALEFCIAFTKRWHAVACDANDRIWTLADLQRTLRAGKGMGFRS